MLGKLGFVHRRLWQRDGTYRLAFLAGPAPLAGLVVATGAWLGLHAGAGVGSGRVSGGTIPWAHYASPVVVSSGPPIVLEPHAPLPPQDGQGRLEGLTTGWRVRLLPMTVDTAFATDITQVPLATFETDDTVLDLDRAVEAWPSDGLFLAGEATNLVIRKAGVYGLTIEAERVSERSANCLIKFNVANQRLVSNIRVNISGSFRHIYDPARFRLLPGLYVLAVGLSCWRGQHVVGPGRVTVMIKRPGAQALEPISPSDIGRAAEAG